MATGAKDDMVAKALTLYGTLNHNWKNLYMVLEIIEDDAGGEAGLIETAWISRGKLKTFKHTANSFRAVGREARHATAKPNPPSVPMSLREAQELIKSVLKEWLRSKSKDP